MTRTFWITLPATVVLSSFAVAAENGGKVWWPQFRGPNSYGAILATPALVDGKIYVRTESHLDAFGN